MSQHVTVSHATVVQSEPDSLRTAQHCNFGITASRVCVWPGSSAQRSAALVSDRFGGGSGGREDTLACRWRALPRALLMAYITSQVPSKMEIGGCLPKPPVAVAMRCFLTLHNNSLLLTDLC